MKIAASLLLASFISVQAGSGDKLSDKSLDTLFGLMQPTSEEMIWKDSIPWRTDLWEARREAAAAGKPIYLWEMDGHPLGCT